MRSNFFCHNFGRIRKLILCDPQKVATSCQIPLSWCPNYRVIFDLGMIVVLDQCTKKLSLYSANVKVCGVHFSYSPSVQLAHIAQEIATLHIGVFSWILSDYFCEVLCVWILQDFFRHFTFMGARPVWYLILACANVDFRGMSVKILQCSTS